MTMLFQGSFNPLSTGHARESKKAYTRLRTVSIPYLRVTHEQSFGSLLFIFRVSIPYLRVTHENGDPLAALKAEFQSPIYGSRTIPFIGSFSRHSSFNPLSTGHALGHTERHLTALPVSIPYLRVTHLLCFGHA